MRHNDRGLVNVKRSPRYFYLQECWFFKTRESGEQGPYTSIEDAVDSVRIYIGLAELNHFKKESA